MTGEGMGTVLTMGLADPIMVQAVDITKREIQAPVGVRNRLRSNQEYAPGHQGPVEDQEDPAAPGHEEEDLVNKLNALTNLTNGTSRRNTHHLSLHSLRVCPVHGRQGCIQTI